MDDGLQTPIWLKRRGKKNDLFEWGSEENLSEEIVLALMQQGFRSVRELRSSNLSPEQVDFYFHAAGLLNKAQCRDLKAALCRLCGPSVQDVRKKSKEDDDDNYCQTLQALSTATVREDVPREFSSPHQTRSPAVDKVWRENTVRLLLLGKTGSGKSTTGNTILGEVRFSTAANFGSVTSECERQVGVREGTRYEIMDSPGLYDTHKTHEQICTIIVQAVAGMHPGPHAVLYVVRVGRFTQEEFDAYRRLKMLFDDSISRHMILLFTHGDDLLRQGTTLEAMIASPNTPDTLKQVFEEVDHRYLLFDNTAKDTQPQVDKLLMAVRKLVAQKGGRPYCCPKYSKIGEGLEQEVNKRVDEFEKRDLHRQKYVQQLENETRLAQQKANRTQEEFQRKEQEREEQLRAEEERRKKVEKDLQEKMRLQEQNMRQQQAEMDKLQKERARQEEQERQMRKRQEKISKDEERRLKREAEEMRRKEQIMMEQLKQQQLQMEQQHREEKEERRRLEKERIRLQRQQEEQRRRDVEEIDRRYKQAEEQRKRQLKAEREDAQRRERIKERKMEELKDRVAKNEEPGFLEKAISFVAKPIKAFFSWFS